MMRIHSYLYRKSELADGAGYRAEAL